MFQNGIYRNTKCAVKDGFAETVIYIVLYESVLYVEVMYYFTEEDNFNFFKIHSGLKGFN